MTTIIGRKNNNGILEIVGDTKTTDQDGNYRLNSNKIIKLDNILLGKAGDNISQTLIIEIYNKWKYERECKFRKDNNILPTDTVDVGINSILESIDFFNYVIDNSNISKSDGTKAEISFIILHNDFQISISSFKSGQVTEYKSGDYISIGSGSFIFDVINYVYNKKNIEFTYEEIFDIISGLDVYTGNKIEKIELSLDNIIETN